MFFHMLLLPFLIFYLFYQFNDRIVNKKRIYSKLACFALWKPFPRNFQIIANYACVKISQGFGEYANVCDCENIQVLGFLAL